MRNNVIAAVSRERGKEKAWQWVREDWLQRISVILAGLFLLQFIFWIQEENMWLEGTYSLALYTVMISAVIELFTKLNRMFRLILQLIMIALMHVNFMYQEPVPFKLKQLWNGLLQNIALYFPEFGISLAVWIVYVFGLWWVRKKYRIYILVLFSVLAVAIRDSYSLLILWDQAAVMLLCGIALIIVRHFTDLKKKDPKSWTYLSEYPGIVALPIVILITLTAVAGIFVPNIPATVIDPYTAWKQWRGEPITYTGKGQRSMTAALLDSSSGYSRSDQQLGGGFNYDYSPVMTVETTQASYWRGDVLSTYTGKGWVYSGSELEHLSPVTHFGEDLEMHHLYSTDKLQTVEVFQSITMLNDQPYPVFFGSYSIEKVLGMDYSAEDPEIPLPNLLVWNEKSSVIRWNSRMKMYPVQYTIVSQMPVLNPDGLRQIGLPQYDPTIWRDDLQLPATLPTRVRELAKDITQEADNAYDKVKAIEQYLSATFPYSSKPDISKGKSADFVDQFLFEIKEGYCDYYSTAMVVMTRTLGIPARWVKGFTTGVLPAHEMMDLLYEELSPSGEGVYTVRNADAHSWVEVYFEGYGWIPFEPTAGFSLPTAWLSEDAASEWLPEIASPVKIEADHGAQAGSIYKVVILSLVAIICAWLLWKYVVLRLFFRNRMEQMNVNDRIVYEFNRLFRWLRRKGHTRYDHETARETIQRWERSGSLQSNDLYKLLAVFERAKYGDARLSEQDWLRATEILGQFRSQTKRTSFRKIGGQEKGLPR